MQAVLAHVQAARERGYSITVETYTAGLNAMAAPVRLAGQPPLGVVSIAGPTVRFTEARMESLAPELLSSRGSARGREQRLTLPQSVGRGAARAADSAGQTDLCSLTC